MDPEPVDAGQRDCLCHIGVKTGNGWTSITGAGYGGGGEWRQHFVPMLYSLLCQDAAQYARQCVRLFLDIVGLEFKGEPKEET